MRKTPIVTCICALLSIGDGVSSADGATLRVPEDHETIQGAVDAAETGDEVLVAPGLYEVTEPIRFLGKAIRLRSAAGPEATEVRMTRPRFASTVSVFLFENAEPEEAILEGFTITGGRGTRVSRFVGGAIYCAPGARPQIRGNVFEDNRAQEGGAIYADTEVRLALSGNLFRNNRAELAAGALSLSPGAAASLAGDRFEQNVCPGSGGAISAQDGTRLLVTHVTFVENRGSGGAVHFSGIELTISNSTFRENVSDLLGGAVQAMGNQLRLEDCVFEENRSLTGGAIYSEVHWNPVAEPRAQILRCRFFSNEAKHAGGALFLEEDSWRHRFESCRFEGNRSWEGGAIQLDEDADADFVECVFVGNDAAFGGALSVEEGSVLLEHSTVTGNSASVSGGGIESNEGAIALRGSILWDNAAGSIGGDFQFTASFSCLELPQPPPGEGNIVDDPLFAGWPGDEDVYVDPTNPEVGDGTRERPYRDLSRALGEFDLALSPTSPCRASAEGGANMGADTGVSDQTGSRRRRVHLAPGDYDASRSVLAHHVSLLGSGYRATKVRGPMVGLRTDAELAHLTVRGSEETAIVIGGGEAPTVRDCLITGNRGEESAAISCGENSSPLFRNCTVSGNTSLKGAAVQFIESAATFVDGIIWGNAGRTLHVVSELRRPVIRFSCVEGELPEGEGNINSDPRFGAWGDWGEVFVDPERGDDSGDGTQELPYRTLEGAFGAYEFGLAADSPCVGRGEGGGNQGVDAGTVAEAGSRRRLVHLAGGAYEIRGLQLSLGLSLEGSGPDSLVVGTVFGLRTGNRVESLRISQGERGGLFVSPGEAPEITRCLVTQNRSEEGAGIGSFEAELSIRESTISENVSRGRGGGAIWADGGSLVIQRSTLERNYSWSYGGALFAHRAAIRLEECRLESNRAVQAGGVFGGMGSRITLARTVVMGNAGGSLGVLVTQSAGLELENCLIAGNLNNQGRAVIFNSGGEVRAAHCTIADNFGEAMYCTDSSTAEVINCLSWANDANDLCEPSAGSITDRDPLFVRPGTFSRFRFEPASNPGVSVPDFIVDPGDYRLQGNSPAVDRGVLEGAPETDLDGVTRPCGEGVDVGAYEQGGCGLTLEFRRGDSNGDGSLNMSDPVLTLGFLFLGFGTTCEKALDADDSGFTDLSDAVYSLNYLFRGGPEPLPPFPACGSDPGADDLTCEAFAGCANG